MIKILSSMLVVFALGCGADTTDPNPQSPDGGMILPPLECVVEGSRCHQFNGPQCCATTPNGVAMICNHETCERKCSQFGAPCDTVADCCQSPFKAQCLGHACTPDI